MMTIEMSVLAYIGVFALILTLIQGTRNVLLLGLPTAAGNQHDIDPWTGWNDRLNRAISNLIEAIIIFAPVAVAVQLSGLNNDISALGAQVFLVARIAHAVVYVVGIPYVRTTAWSAGVAGILMLASPLFT